MHRPTYTNVNWNLNIKKIRAAQGGPLNRGAPCHGIIGILVNPALIVIKYCGVRIPESMPTVTVS